VKALNPRVARMVILLHPVVPPAPPAPAYPNALANMPAPAPGAKRYVMASRLNMRAAPSLDGDLVGRLPSGSEVTVLEDNQRVALVVNGIYGHWVKVQMQNLSGYVFDAYLLPFPAPQAGSDGLWGYADDTLKAKGPENKKRQGDKSQGEEWTFQDYQHGARIEDHTWWGPGVNGHATTLVLHGISVEQAFILAQRCEKALRGAQFKAGIDGTVRVSTPDAHLVIQSQDDGSVRITESNTL